MTDLKEPKDSLFVSLVRGADEMTGDFKERLGKILTEHYHEKGILPKEWKVIITDPTIIDGLKRDIASGLMQAARDGITRHESERAAGKLVDRRIKEGE